MMQGRDPCLLWMEEWGIWDQNLHLYYRLRQGYGDQRLLCDRVTEISVCSPTRRAIYFSGLR